MARNQSNKNTDVKNKVLAASRELFSSKGYDATGMDEISKKAEVTKSLIYYYFENKEKILEQLLEENTNDYIKQKQELSEQVTQLNASEIGGYADRSFFALKDKEDIIKIALLQALKDDRKDYSLFKMMDMSFGSQLPKVKEMGLNIQDEADSQITGFFFGVAPVILSIILGEKWAEFHGIDMDEFNQKFSKRLKDFYIKYIEEFLSNDGK